MTRTRNWRLLSPALAAAAFAVAVLQRPGDDVADTKIDLHVDPVGFLAEVASVWSDSGGLGQVQAGQYSGYLFPMGPFFALGNLVGLPAWLVQRIWLGLLLALAAWGTVRLLDALLDRERGAAHVVAGLLVIFNPYVVVYANRTTVTLLGYAALPWLLLIVQRGVRDPRRLWWAAAFALVLASTGGGVNAAVTAWLLVGPILLALHEAAFGPVSWRAVASFAWRAAGLAVLASLWWIVPVAAHARYGLNFLPFTESPGSIWDTTGVSESVRLMGYWITYLGIGYSDTLVPYFDTAGTYLFDWPVVLATFAVPALTVAGLVFSLRWRYGPFFLALLLVGLLVTAAGFPEGAPLRRALTFAYYRVEAVQFLRTTYKAAPLVSISLVMLAGVAAGEVWRRLGGMRAPLAVAAAVLVGLTALPMLEGRAIDEQVVYDVPEEWERAARDLDRELPRGSRAMILPGQVFPFYEWGGTQDPILPALSDRPVANRYIVPYSDLHAVDLQFTVDSLLTQQRAIPGQLGPLLDLMGVRSVVTGTDDDRVRSGSVEPAAAAEQLAAEPALGEPEREYGAAAPLARVRRYDLARARPVVRVEPSGPGLVVDGSAEALAGLAAFGALPREGPILYAGDAGAGELRDAAAGGEVVVSDSNRRRVFISSRPNQNVGATLAAGDEISRDGAVLNPFAERGADAQTVAELDGAAWIRAPFSPQFPQFPEHRPFAAFDGDPETWWIADRYLDTSERRIEIRFDEPRDVPSVDLLTKRESRTGVGTVEVGGQKFEVKPGWNRLRLGLREVDGLEVKILRLVGPDRRFRGPGALAEVRIPGVGVSEALRTPVLAQRALSAGDLSRTGLTYLFARTTGDDPFNRAPEVDADRGFVPSGRNQEAALVRAPGDGETQIRRVVEPPVARAYEPDAFVTLAPGAAGGAAAGCGALRVFTESGASVSMRVRGAVRPGRPLRAEACGGDTLDLPAGRTIVETESERFRPLLVRLRSPAPGGAEPPRGGGRVVSAGDSGRGSYEGVKVEADGPSWLVLGESFNLGWKASCDGDDLGEPRPVDGFANGWRIEPGCTDVDIEFGPNRQARWSYAISLVAVLGMLVLLVLRRPRRQEAEMDPNLAGFREPRVGPLSLRVALLVGIAAALAGGFLFALRAGVVIGPLLLLLLWRGVSARALVLTAAGLLGIVVPALYLILMPEDLGGFNSEYALDLIAAHWVAVAAYVLLALALWAALSTARGRRDARAPAPADAAAGRSRP